MPLDLPRPPERRRHTTSRPVEAVTGVTRTSQGGLRLPPKRVSPAAGGPATNFVHNATVTTPPVVVTPPYYVDDPHQPEQPPLRPTNDRLAATSSSVLWTDSQPQHVPVEEDNSGSTTPAVRGGTTTTTLSAAAGSVELPATNDEGLPKGWALYYTEDGTPYYMDLSTGQSTWDRPAIEDHHPADEPSRDEPNTDAANTAVGSSTVLEEEAAAAAVETTTTEPALPAGWVRAVSDTGGTYYWNESEQISSWELPQLETSQGGAFEKDDAPNTTVLMNYEEDQSPPPDEPPPRLDVIVHDPGAASAEKEAHVNNATLPDDSIVPLPPGWIESITDEGMPYYYNQDDGTSSWERPTPHQPQHHDDNDKTLGEPEHPPAIIDHHVEPSAPVDYLENEEPGLVEPPQDDDEDVVRNNNEEIKTMDGAVSDVLPPGWIESWTEDGTAYYYNEVDGTTSWDRPQSESDAVDAAPATATEQHVEPANGALLSDVDMSDPVLPPGWCQDYTEEGQVFYYNQVDGSTSWDFPRMSNHITQEELDADAAMEQHDANPIPEASTDHVDDTPETTHENRGGFEAASFLSELQHVNEDLPYGSEAVDATNGAPPEEPSHGLVLPPGWSQNQTAEGETYYCNDADGTTYWELPHFKNDLVQGYGTSGDAAHENVVEETHEEYLDEAPETSIEKDEKIDVPPGWTRTIDDDGMPYFSRTEDDEQHSLTAANLHDRFENETVEKQTLVDGQRASSVKSDEFSYEDIHHEPERVDNGLGFASAPESTNYGAGESLPDGWVIIEDKNTGSRYYLNETNGQTSWEKPDVVEADWATECPGQEESGPVETENDVLPVHWRTLVSNDGTPYYVNETTGETTWIRPDSNDGRNLTTEDVRAESATDDLGESSPFTALEETLNRSPLSSDDVPESTCPQNPEVEDPAIRESSVSGVGPDDNEVLPHGWTKNPVNGGGFYYYNKETNESTWELPRMDPPPSEVKFFTDDAVTQQDSDNGEISASNPLPSGWSQQINDDGAPYYFNEVTNETSWERPLPPSDETSAPPTALPDTFKPVSYEAKASKNAPQSITEVNVLTDVTSLNQPVAANIENNDCDLNANEVPESGQGALALTWVEEFNDEGEAYYYCHQTGETTWDKPELYMANLGSAESSPSLAESNTPLAPQVRANSSVSSYEQSGLHVVGKRSGACVSVGFGGRLCVVQRRQNESVLTIKMLHTELTRERICAVEKCKHSHGVSGPLAAAEHSAVSRYIELKTSQSTNDLWHLVAIAAESKGRLQSAQGAIDPTSPEARIVNILLRSDYQFVENLPSAHDDTKGENLEALERLLLNGQRTEALQAALDCGNFAMAMVIAKVVESEDRHNVYRIYLDQPHFHGKALRTMSMLFSESLTVGTSINYWNEMSDDTLLHTWKHHLAGILSNPVKGWNCLVLSLGQRLQRIEKAGIIPSQFCYLVGGGSLGTPSSGVPTWLLGFDQDCHALHLRLDAAVDSFALTEAYEWSKRQGNRNASIASLQTLKIWYALILCEYGFVDSAAKYVHSCIEQLDAAAKAGTKSVGSSDTSFLDCLFSDDAHAIHEVARQLKNRLDGEYSWAPSPPETESQQDVSFATARGDTSIDETIDPSPAFVAPTLSPKIPPFESVGDAKPSESTTAVTQSEQSRPVSQRPNLPSLSTDEPSSGGPPLITPAGPSVIPKPRSAPKSAPANLQGNRKPGEPKSFFSFGFKDSVTKWLNPDAVKADLGDGMQAYYDADKKVWVFPGEDPAEKAKPIAPPPMAVSSPATAPATAAADVSNDPLAAMMAPPPRPLKPLSAKKTPNSSSMPGPAGTMVPPGGRPPVNFQAFMPPKPSDT